MTLKAKILTLWCRGHDYDQIVEAVGCRREYVRAIISRSRLALSPEWQARTSAYKRAWRARRMAQKSDAPLVEERGVGDSHNSRAVNSETH